MIVLSTKTTLVYTLKILTINFSDYIGGAARTAYRLNQELSKTNEIKLFSPSSFLNIKSKQVPLGKLDKQTLRLKSKISQFCTNLSLKNDTHSPFSFSVLSNQRELRHALSIEKPDLVMLHWIGGGLLSIHDLLLLKNLPLIWTLHDINPLTGGCHIAFDCLNYKNGCQSCPHLRCNTPNLASREFDIKKNVYSKLNLSLISPSRWLYDKSVESLLFSKNNKYHIPNGIDCTVFKPFPKDFARSFFNIPSEKKILAVGSVSFNSDYNKGADLFFNSIRMLSRAFKKELCVLVFGSREIGISYIDELMIYHTGPIHDDFTLSLLYNAADLFVIPSRSENFPTTLLESLACGTPALGFDIGGVSELISSDLFGKKISPYSTSDLKDAIENWNFKSDNKELISRFIFDKYDIKLISNEYSQVLNALVSK